MIFDKKQHKDLLLELLDKVGVQGKDVEAFYDCKMAVKNGTVTDGKEVSKNGPEEEKH